jgi:hypothetical protein
MNSLQQAPIRSNQFTLNAFLWYGQDLPRICHHRANYPFEIFPFPCPVWRPFSACMSNRAWPAVPAIGP